MKSKSKKPVKNTTKSRWKLSWKTVGSVVGGGVAASVLYTQWAAAQLVPPSGSGAPIPIGISVYYCYNPATGTTSQCSGNPDNGYDNSGNYFVGDPQNYDYNSDPGSYPNQTFGDEYVPQRQQYLLKNAIYQGQNNQTAAADNFNTTIPALLEQGAQNIAAACENGAFPAYDTASQTFADASAAYQNAADAYSDASAEYQTARGSFNVAAYTPYIYDQLQGMNLATGDYTFATSKLADAEREMALAQQQLAEAQKLYTDAAKAGLQCQAMLSVTNTNFAYNTAQTNSYLLYAMSQQQEQSAAQKQVDNTKLAQEVRTTYGLQQANAMALQGLVPTTGGALPVSPRPDRY
ncbi:MAG: hypothetical protein H7Y22_01110 [Gemmatimonadaceae bacterium]|nr:hypothetical protein [Gloeobacterales cyanobacterium ES-bin-141]